VDLYGKNTIIMDPRKI